MLSALKTETQRPELANSVGITKLEKLITWEILFLHITQCLDEWNRKSFDIKSLGKSCKLCLSAIYNADALIPRIEV